MSFENYTFEGEATEPKATQNRSAFAVLESLSDNPLEQARKFVGYAASCDQRKAKLANKLSEGAVALVKAHYPGVL